MWYVDNTFTTLYAYGHLSRYIAQMHESCMYIYQECVRMCVSVYICVNVYMIDIHIYDTFVTCSACFYFR